MIKIEMEANKMELNLCDKGCCPKVVSVKDGVEIGEEENLVKLKPSEWNTLVDGIKTGKLDKI